MLTSVNLQVPMITKVLVHPDKNQHPQATRAFQRVAAAWAVLSDPQKRRDYDQEFPRGHEMGPILGGSNLMQMNGDFS